VTEKDNNGDCQNTIVRIHCEQFSDLTAIPPKIPTQVRHIIRKLI
jgi:hypothetical protein